MNVDKICNTEKFIKKAKEIWGDLYDYSKSVYTKSNEKLIVICKKHGEFEVSPNNHTHKGSPRGCPLCRAERISGKRAMSKETFLERMKNIFGSKYDFSESIYVNSKTPIEAICPIHGKFKKTPNELFKGRGCQRCNPNLLSTDEFKKRANLIHDNLYDYSKSIVTGRHDKVCIGCKKHGYFWQEVGSHLSGAGCPSCNNSELENNLSKELSKLGISFVKRFVTDYSENKSYDFMLPNFGILIECQGEQHFRNVDFFGGNDKFETQVENDIFKNRVAKERGYDLLYLFKSKKDIEAAISFNEIYNKNNCFVLNDLIEHIKLYNMNVDKICEELIWYGKKFDDGKYGIYIIVDFDFTITKESSWLKGTFTENDHCIETMKKWENEFGVKFILETMRGEKHIQPAIDFCKSKGIEFFGIGRNPLQDSDGDLSCKCWGVFDIDDRNCMIPLIHPKNARPYVNWEILDYYMTPILRKIQKRMGEVEERVLEAKRLAHEENKFVEIDYSY